MLVLQSSGGIVFQYVQQLFCLFYYDYTLLFNFNPSKNMFDLTITFLFSYFKTFPLHDTKSPFNMNLKVSWKKNVNVVIHATPTSQKNLTPLVEAPCRKKID